MTQGAEKAARRIAVPMDVVIASLAKCIVCDEPESDKYREEVEYWLEQLVGNLREERAEREKERKL